MRSLYLPLLLAVSLPLLANAQNDPAPAKKSILRPGSEEPAQVQTPVAPAAEPEAEPAVIPPRNEDESFRIGLGISYYGARKVSFKDVDLSPYFGPSASKTNVDMDIDSGAGLALSLQYMPTQHWGILGIANLETQRRIKGGSTSISGVTVTRTDDKLSFVTLDGNVAYRWEQFYVIPFGVNITALSYKADGSGAAVKTLAGMGLQAGIGAMITSNIALDVMVKSAAFGLEETYNGNKIKYERGTMAGAYADLRFIF